MREFIFDDGTAEAVQRIIKYCYDYRLRVRIWYGFTEGYCPEGTDKNLIGKPWLEEYDVAGKIGRSTGIKPAPLLIHSSRSHGGGAISTSSIVRIDEIGAKNTLYKHPKYKDPHYEILNTYNGEHPEYTHSVKADGVVCANFKSEKKAENYVQFMLGNRYRT